MKNNKNIKPDAIQKAERKQRGEMITEDIKRPKGLSKYIRPYRTLESYPGAVSKTERIGFVSGSKRMKRIMLAGENLQLYRAASQLYDAAGVTDINRIDWDTVAVRSLGYGLAEYSEHVNAIAQRKARLTEQTTRETKADKAMPRKTPEPAPAVTPPSGAAGGPGAALAPAPEVTK